MLPKAVILLMFIGQLEWDRVSIGMENALGKTWSAEGMLSELIDSSFSLQVHALSVVACSWQAISKLVSFKCQTFLN